MALADLKNVLHIFGGSEVTEDQQNELFKEVLLMTLARAADAAQSKGNAQIAALARQVLIRRVSEEQAALGAWPSWTWRRASAVREATTALDASSQSFDP